MKGAIGKIWTINLNDELKTLKRKLDCLIAIESDNLRILENAEIQPGKKRKCEVEWWFANVEAKRSITQQFETELREKGPSRNLKSRIEDETKEVEELIQQGKFPAGVVLDDHESTRIQMVTTTLVGQSCTEKANRILKLLKEDVVSAIGVYGMGGVGKTTLVKKMYNCLLADTDIAGRVYWVTASRDCSLEKLQIEIGKVLGLKLSLEDKERKKALLSQRLSEMKKSVIILDDLWKHYLLEKVGIPLDSCGCKIVVTTRSLVVCCRMGCQEIIKIEPLLEEDAWKLFAKHSGEIPSHFIQLAEEIVEECGGLPLALITMGCCARAYVNVHDWENALYELRRPVSRQEVMEEEVFRVLKFSFDSLKDQNIQNCFLCCALFPEDRKIFKKYLVDLWIDAGLLDEVPSPQDKAIRGHSILTGLVRSCLLEETTKKDGVRMHDLVRDMATIITQNHCRFMVKSGEDQRNVSEVKQWSKDLVKVSLSHNRIKEIPNGMTPFTPELRVLMLNHNPLSGIPESFFMHMRILTVLDLSETKIERLPESVSDLKNLRALLLACCKKLTYVPCLAMLSKLRVLDLYDDFNLEKAPEGIERLKCLEKVTYWPWDVSDSIGFNKLIESSPSLSCYRFLLCCPVWFKTFCVELFWDMENLVSLGRAEIGDDNSTYLLPTTIKRLEIVECVVKRRILGDVFPTLGLATELRDLFIWNCIGFKYILSSTIVPHQVSFIKDMTLYDLPDLSGIIEFGGCTFSHLCRLQIEYCPKIKVIFPFSEKQLSLPNLYKLMVSYCDELEEIFMSRGSSSSSSSILQGKTDTLVVDPINACIPQPNPISVLPKLELIYLGNLPKLGSIYKDLHLCTSLKKLEVEDCPIIERIFESPEPVLALHKLRELYLERLPKLSSIHRGLLFCTSLMYLNIQGCSKLKRVPLSNHLICDKTPSSLLSIPSDSENPELWDLLRRDYSEDAHLLSEYIQYQQHNHNHIQLNLEDNAPQFTDNIEHVSLPASLITDADEDKNNWLNDQLLLPQLVLTEDEQYQIRSWGASLSLSWFSV